MLIFSSCSLDLKFWMLLKILLFYALNVVASRRQRTLAVYTALKSCVFILFYFQPGI